MVSPRPPSVMAAKRGHVKRDPNSLVASVAIMTGPNKSNAKMTVAAWQDLAWSLYDDIGELRFGTNWLANAMSRVNLIAAIPPVNQGDEPTPIDAPTANPAQRRAVELVSQIAGGVAGQGQLLAGCAKQLTVPGVGYILASADDTTDSFSTWRVLSNDEARLQNGVMEVANPETGTFEPLADDDLLLKVWRSHPRRGWEPDSPVRAVLGPLAEIKLLSQRIAADARSRLAGNGLLVVPEEAEFPPGQGNVTGTGEGADEFIETLVQVTQIPISDQSSPAATTPLVIRVPGEFVDKVKHLTFYSSFDLNLEPLRQAAIKRVALGMDMPPEVLLGMGDSNHWSAWQIAEEAITLQIEPLAETIVHALTVGFLRSALEAEKLDPDTAIVWYDTTDLSTRPDVSGNATVAHADGKISDDAWLGYLGLDAADRPTDEEFVRNLLVSLAKASPEHAPALLAAAGFTVQLPNMAPPVFGNQPADDAPVDATDQTGSPDTQDQAADPPADDAALAAAVTAASADGLVVRALERAGSRLRAAAGKGRGGSGAVACPDPTLLHTTIPATDFASLDHLLADAWDRVPEVAARCGVDPASLTRCLDGYTRGLIAAGAPHDFGKLSRTLGVHDRHLVAAN